MTKSFSTGTDSPVKAASSILMVFTSNNRISAGTTSPASKITISPTTISSPFTCRCSPSRKTVATGEAIFCNASIASSAFDSWITPTIAFKITTAKITIASVGSGAPSWAKNEITAAASKTIIMKSLN